MIVATYDTAKNSQITCNCKQYGHELICIKSWKEIPTRKIIFCVDRQAVEEELKGYDTYEPDEYYPDTKDATLVFGKNDGMKIGQEAIEASAAITNDVDIIYIRDKVLWAESAMAIILYEFAKDD